MVYKSVVSYCQKVKRYSPTNTLSRLLSSSNVFRLSQGQNRLLSFDEVLFPPSSPKFAPAKLRSASSPNRASPLLGGCPSTSRRTTPLLIVVEWGSSVGTERDERPDCPRDERVKARFKRVNISKISPFGTSWVYLSIQTTVTTLLLSSFQDLEGGTENNISQALDVEHFDNFNIINLFQTNIGIQILTTFLLYLVTYILFSLG